MDNFEIIIRKRADVTCNTSVDLLRVAIVGEVGMVDVGEDGFFGAHEIVSPFCEAKDESQEFFVPDVIVLLGGSKCARGVANSTAFSPIILLEEDGTECKVRSVSFQVILAIMVGGDNFRVFGDFSNEFV